MHALRTVRRGRALARAHDAVGESQRRARQAVVWAAVACALLLARPVAAQAGWPLAAPGRVVLAFGAVYSAGEGDSSQHRGVDIEAAAGDAVVAPLPGKVSFVGSVPGVGGGRVTAVTIETASGKITLMPLSSASVSRGSQVAEGDGLGKLAGSGDGSSDGAHLHVGAREGDLYVDPLGLMAPPPAPNEGSGAGAGAGVVVGAGATAGAGASVVVPAGGTLSAGVSVAPAASGSVATKPSAQAKVAARAKVAAGGEIASGVSVVVRAPAAAKARASSTKLRVTASSGVPAPVAGSVQPTVLTKDGVVVAASSLTAGRQAARPAWAGIVTRLRAFLQRSVRMASLVLLGVMAALGALWPLWRGAGKGSGKVLVSTIGEDVAAAPSR